MDTTKKIRQSNTVDFFPTTADDPTTSPTETLSLIIEDLLTVLKDPPLMSPFLPQTLGLTNAIESLQSILHPPRVVENTQEQRVHTPEIRRLDLPNTPTTQAPI